MLRGTPSSAVVQPNLEGSHWAEQSARYEREAYSVIALLSIMNTMFERKSVSSLPLPLLEASGRGCSPQEVQFPPPANLGKHSKGAVRLRETYWS